MGKKLLNVAETAEYLGIAEKTLYKWVHLKQIPYVKLSHRTLRFDVHDLDVWIDENKLKPVDPAKFMPQDGNTYRPNYN